MGKLSCVFLCGDRSPYGMAHLEPIAAHFDLKAIVIADDARWGRFSELLSGGDSPSHRKRTLVGLARSSARLPLVFYRKQRHRARLRSTTADVIKLNNANTRETQRLIGRYSPDVLLSAAYPQILGKGTLKIADRGSVNFHPSPLPRFRGAHPHYWCLATGDETGGVTAHYMTTKVDCGDIIAQRTFDLTGFYYADLYGRIVEETPHLVKEVAEFFNDPDARAKRQDESRATLFRADREIHRRLDFGTMGAKDLLNRIRAGRAYAHHRGVRIDIDRAHLADGNRNITNGISVPPGVIVDVGREGLVVSTSDGPFLVIEIVRSGDRRLTINQWVGNQQIRIGESFV